MGRGRDTRAKSQEAWPAQKKRKRSFALEAEDGKVDWNRMNWPSWMQAVLLATFVNLAAATAFAMPTSVSFNASATSVEAYDFIEITLRVASPDAVNPFSDVSVEGLFETTDGSRQWKVNGFCDSADGSLFRIRFMPAATGDYKYRIVYRQGAFEKASFGTFHASDGHRAGPIRVDAQYPWHFIWEGTGQHYFLNGTTAYFLMGFQDQRIVEYSIARLHRLKVNRMRVTLAGRTIYFFGERVSPDGRNWTVFLAPWPAEKVDDFSHPGFDYKRFNVAYWERWDEMLRFARDQDMIISIVLDMNDNKVHPAAGSEDEHRYIQYAVNRVGAFSNITWDLGDDLDVYRDENWSHETGTLLEGWDPYKHLATTHPALDMTHQDRSSDWFGFTSYQDWSRGREQHDVMLTSRKRQEATGRIIPQTNEEYGYEDHYPTWAPAPPGDSADELRRTAWTIVMAGAYQDTGESTRQGTNIWPDTGGGWFNGRGDDNMTMLQGYGHMVDFFTSFKWWKTNPHDELVDNGNYCLADPGKIYVVYLPHAGKVTVHSQAGHYLAQWFNPRTGEYIPLPAVEGGVWTSPDPEANNPEKWPTTKDWVLFLQNQ
jgi:hypothetical protein